MASCWELGSLEIGGVEKELTSPTSAVWTCSFCHRSYPFPIKVKCSRFGKQPCPVCQRACRKYCVCQAPEEKALVIALITTMALHLLVPATFSSKDHFMERKFVARQGDNHILRVLLT